MFVRSASSDDADAIAELFGAAWAASLSMVPKMHSAAEDRVYFRGIVRNQTVFVADDGDGIPLAFIALTSGWVNHLYVHPGHHRRGIGSALLRHAKSLQSQLTLWTFQANAAARRFYESHGFEAVALTDGSANEERTPDVRYHWVSPNAISTDSARLRRE